MSVRIFGRCDLMTTNEIEVIFDVFTETACGICDRLLG